MALAWTLPLVLQNTCTCEGPVPLQIGYIPNAGCSLLSLAVQQHLFEHQKLQVEIKSYPTLAEVQTALAQDAIDIFCSSLAELLLVPIDYKVILIPGYSNGADVLIGRKDAGTNLSELKGARVGVPPASMGELLLNRALSAHSLTRDDFTVLPEDAKDLLNALQKSEIQLAVAAPPYSLQILQNTEMQAIYRSSAMPGEIIDTLAASASILHQSPRLVQKLEKVWNQALQYTEQHPTEAYQVLSQSSGFPVATFQQDYKFLTLPEQREYLKPEGHLFPLIDQLQSSFQRSGSLKNKREPQQFIINPTIK